MLNIIFLILNVFLFFHKQMASMQCRCRFKLPHCSIKMLCNCTGCNQKERSRVLDSARLLKSISLDSNGKILKVLLSGFHFSQLRHSTSQNSENSGTRSSTIQSNKNDHHQLDPSPQIGNSHSRLLRKAKDKV